MIASAALLVGAAGCSDDDRTCALGPGLCGKDAAVDLRAPDAGADSATSDTGKSDSTPTPDATADTQGTDTLAADTLAADTLTADTLTADTLTADSAPATDAPYVHEDISAANLQSRLIAGEKLTVLDVREPGELVAGGKIAGALNMPWVSGGLKKDFGKLPTNQPIVVVCQSGGRSNAAADFLVTKGFIPVYDMLGGMTAWVAAGYPVQK